LRSSPALRRAPKTLARRADLRLARAMPKAGQGLGMSQPQSARFPQARFYSPHASKAMQSKMMFPDRLLGCVPNLIPKSCGHLCFDCLALLARYADYRSIMDSSAGREDRQEQIGLMSQPLSAIHQVADVILVPVRIATLGT